MDPKKDTTTTTTQPVDVQGVLDVPEKAGISDDPKSSMILQDTFNALFRVFRLVTLGYQESRIWRERYVDCTEQDWEGFASVLHGRTDCMVFTSGLLLAANVNLLGTGELSEATWTLGLASVCCSLMSIVWGLLCMWVLRPPTNLRELTLSRRRWAFQLMFSAPSAFCGASTVFFFVAIGTWVLLDVKRGAGGFVPVLMMVAVLVTNGLACFWLGGVDWNSIPATIDSGLRYYNEPEYNTAS